MSLSACDDYRKRHSEIEDEVYAGGLGVVAIAGVFLANVLLRFIPQKVYERVTWVVISVSGFRLALF